MKPHHNRALKEEEEETIVPVLIRQAYMGKPFNTQDIKEAVHVFGKSLPIERQESLQFRGDIPGRDFFKGFLNRHEYITPLGRPAK